MSKCANKIFKKKRCYFLKRNVNKIFFERLFSLSWERKVFVNILCWQNCEEKSALYVNIESLNWYNFNKEPIRHS